MDYRALKRIAWRWTKRLLAIWLILNVYAWFINSAAVRSTLLMYMFYGAFIIFWTGGQIFFFMFFMARTKDLLLMPGQAGLPTLEDYWGQPDLVRTVNQWVELFRGMGKFREMGGKPPTGLLLYGPPGSGKTMLAKCIAGSAQVPFMYLDAPSFTSAWMGIGNIKVALRYRKAKKLAMDYGACIVYIDEIDAIAPARAGVQPRSFQPRSSNNTVHKMLMGGMGGGGSMILSTLLHELDGAMDDFLLTKIRNRVYGFLGLKVPDPDWVVFTFGSTNVPQIIDPALLRSGRLGRKLKVDRPDRAGRREILQGYLSKIKSSPSIDTERLVDELADATPADIKSLVLEEAPRKAVFDGSEDVKMKHFMAALREVQVGLRNPIPDLDMKEREKIAVHESGHALVTWLLTDKRLSTLTIVRYGDALGHVMPTETRQRALHSLNEIWADVLVSIAGRASEIVVYGEPQASVGGDYPHVMGNLQYLLQSGLFGSPVGTEEETSARIRHLFETALQQAVNILEEYRADHWKLVEAVMSQDELGHDEITAILGKRVTIKVPTPTEPESLRKRRKK